MDILGGRVGEFSCKAKQMLQITTSMPDPVLPVLACQLNVRSNGSTLLTVESQSNHNKVQGEYTAVLRLFAVSPVLKPVLFP